MGNLTEDIKRNSLATSYFLILGIGTLISWNGVLNSLDYFKTKFPGWNSESTLIFGFNIGQFVANFFAPALNAYFSIGKRIIGPLLILGATIVLLPFEANVFSDSVLGFWLLMFLFAILGFCTCFFQGTLSGFVSHFPKQYTSTYLMGTGAAGLLMNFLRIIAILSFAKLQDGLLIQMIVYFGVAGFFLVMCSIIHPMFVNSKYYKDYMKNNPSSSEGNSAYTNLEEEESRNDSHLSPEKKPKLGETIKNYLSVFSEVRFFFLILVANFTLSFLVFPGVILQKPTPELSFEWKMITMLLVFDISDIIGKGLGQQRAYYTKWTIVKIVGFRVVVDFFCILQALSSTIPVVSTLWFGYVNMMFFGITSGFVTTASFIMAGESVEGSKKDLAGYLSVFGLTVGLIIGGLLSLPLGNLNPDNQ